MDLTGVFKEEKVGWCHCSNIGWEQASLWPWAALGWPSQEMCGHVEYTKQVLMSLFKLSFRFQNSQSSLGKTFPVPTGSLQMQRINWLTILLPGTKKNCKYCYCWIIVMFLVWCLMFFNCENFNFSIYWLICSELQFEQCTWSNFFLCVCVCLCVYVCVYEHLVIDRSWILKMTCCIPKVQRVLRHRLKSLTMSGERKRVFGNWEFPDGFGMLNNKKWYSSGGIGS